MTVLVACEGDAGIPGGLFTLPADDAREPSSDTSVGGLACVVRHPHLPVAYSVAGRGPGTLHSWSTAGRLGLVTSQPTNGDEPCHIAVHPGGRALIVSNYASGTLFCLTIDADGVPAAHGEVVPLEGDGPVRGRQDSAHPHQALFVQGGDLVLVPDLGADLLRSYTLDLRDASLTPVGASPLPPGTGPRHAVCTPDHSIVLTGELAQTVVVGRLEPETGRVASWRAVPSTGRRPAQPNYPGDLLAHPDGGVVYVANRGADTLAVFRVEGDELRFVEEVPAGVRWPQHLAFADGALLVAGRDSSAVVALPAGRGQDRLGRPRPVAHLPRPVWLAPGPEGDSAPDPSVHSPRR